MSKKYTYEKLDMETRKEITRCVIECLREEESRLKKASNDRKRANIKLVLRKYREIVAHVDESVYEASQLSYDFELQELLEQMSRNGRENLRIESIKESSARSKVMVDHMNKMVEIYRLSCENSNREEERRRYRVLYSLYISPIQKALEEIASEENVDKSTVYRDIDVAADRLAVLFFGVYGLRFL